MSARQPASEERSTSSPTSSASTSSPTSSWTPSPKSSGRKPTCSHGLPAPGERDAIFVTTTSGLSITELGRRSGTGPRLAGTHFWNPPHLMPLVEVIRGADTTEEALDSVTATVRSIGKIPVRVNQDVPGFIGNRLLHALWREAINLVERGIASPEDIDRVARLTFGLRLAAVGPLENMDLVGLDLIERIHQYLLADLSDAHGPLPVLAERVADGRLGMKSGAGFYDWQVRDGPGLIARRDRQIVHATRISEGSSARCEVGGCVFRAPAAGRRPSWADWAARTAT